MVKSEAQKRDLMTQLNDKVYVPTFFISNAVNVNFSMHEKLYTFLEFPPTSAKNGNQQRLKNCDTWKRICSRSSESEAISFHVTYHQDTYMSHGFVRKLYIGTAFGEVFDRACFRTDLNLNLNEMSKEWRTAEDENMGLK